MLQCAISNRDTSQNVLNFIKTLYNNISNYDKYDKVGYIL